MTSRVVFLLCTLLPLAACSTDPVVVDPSVFEKLFVFGVLSPSLKQQEIYISTAQFEENPKPVNDAKVRLVGPVGEVGLPAVGNGLYRDLSGILQASPGQRYHLRITLRDGREISGTTAIPAKFRILSPAAGDTFQVEHLSQYTKLIRMQAAWTMASGSWLARVTVQTNSSDSSYAVRFYRLTADTSASITSSVATPLGGVVDSGFLKVTQYDSALTIYHLTREYYCLDEVYGNLYSPIPCEIVKRIQASYKNRGVNVDGAYGLFGSVVEDSIHFHIKP
ncbi:DUF4249 domain-containing protein [candidate division KSB1 bacterium]|nr:DUF4249 domain-containing protein [candidate division KSB1 bacterium]